MQYLKNFNKFLILILIISCYGCTNTRVIVEGTKKVLQNSNVSTKEISSNNTKGHYKVGNPYVVDGIEYKPKLLSEYNKDGIASWYGPNFHNKMTANGEAFDQNSISAAHKTLPLPSIVKVVNTSNNQFLYIRVNDRGPFVNDRIIDLSKKAAMRLNFLKKGTTKVNVKLIETGPHLLDKKFLDHNYLSNYAKLIDHNHKSTNNVNKKFFLQVGVFSKKDNANTLLNYLKDKINDNLFIEIFSKKNKDILYKVFVGPFFKEDKANLASKKLFDIGYKTIFVKN